MAKTETITVPLSPDDFAEHIMDIVWPRIESIVEQAKIESREKALKECEEIQQTALTEAYNSGYNDALKAIEQRVGDPWSLERGEWDEILKELR